MDGAKSQRQTNAAADLQEVGRRLGNSYALLRSIIRHSAESAKDVESYAWHLEGRLDVIGRIMLAAMRKPDGPFDLRSLIEDELSDQHTGDAWDSWRLSGPPVTMNAAAAEVLGLLFYELVTNSIEHGILGTDGGGELQVTWRVEQGEVGEYLQLDWIERGAPATLYREGFGSLVLEGMLRYQLDAKAERELGPQGVRISLAVPMRSLVQDDAGPGDA